MPWSFTFHRVGIRFSIHGEVGKPYLLDNVQCFLIPHQFRVRITTEMTIGISTAFVSTHLELRVSYGIRYRVPSL